MFTFNKVQNPGSVFFSDMFSISNETGIVWPLTKPDTGTCKVADIGPDLQHKNPTNFSL